jgi:23S rRNA (cytosine1962-C5)-methyltransferase
LELLVKPPCLIFEDDHLLVVNKPPGLNTHASSSYASEGLYEWLREHEPRWANLSIIHRLDKETSGVIVFGKTTLANRSLTEQFTNRAVRKKYLLLTDRSVPGMKLLVKSALARVGDKYVSRPASTAGTKIAQTIFYPIDENKATGLTILVAAEPLTGRTHQIRVHAANKGFPILGDSRYGGTPGPRVCLHAAELTFQHPVSGEQISFGAEADFVTTPAAALRSALINAQATTAFRLINGASDGYPGWYVDRFGSYLLSQSAKSIDELQRATLGQFMQAHSAVGAYHKNLSATARVAAPQEASPRLVLGSAAPERFNVIENGLQFALSFTEGYSVGLFLDQRDNRRRLLTGHVAAGFRWFEPHAPAPKVLNAFAYTCSFSVYAAKAGGHTTSLDLSRKYLEWGKTNFVLNQLNPNEHDFILGDVFDWLRRLHKKERRFDLILLDPPTFSRSKAYGAFRAEKDYGKLVAAALPLLKSGGTLFASCNTAAWPAIDFLATVRSPILASRRAILGEHFFPQPPDFPFSRSEPGYLKTVWLRLQ